MKNLKKIVLVCLATATLGLSATLAHATTQATATSSTNTIHVGDTVTFQSTTPCEKACSLTWTWYNGVNRLGYHMGYGSTINYRFTTARTGPVQLDLAEPSYPGSRLVRHTYATIYVNVLP